MDDNTFNTGSSSSFKTPMWGQATPEGVPTGEPGTEQVQQTQTKAIPQDQLVEALQDQTFQLARISTYTNDPGRPVLPQSKEQDPQLARDGLNKLYDFPAALNRIAEQPQVNATAYDDQFAHVVVDDPEIIALAEKYDMSPGAVLHLLQVKMNHFVEKEIALKFPADKVDEVIYQYYMNPEQSRLTDAEINQLNQIVQNSQERVSDEHDFTPNWQGLPKDSTAFTQQLSQSYSLDLEQEIQRLVREGTITPEEATQLRTMFYMPDEAGPVPDPLKLILQQIMTTAQGNLKTKYPSMGAEWEPAPETEYYNSIVNGDFLQTFKTLVKNYTGNLTEAQKVLLAKYYENPSDPSIPDSIKQLAQDLVNERALLLRYFEDPNDPSIPPSLKKEAQKLIDASISAVVGKYGLSADWKPSVTTLVPVGIDPALIEAANNAMETLKDIFNSAMDFVNSLPDSPEKMFMMDYLKKIGEAINMLQEAIYSMQASSSIVSRAMSRAKLESQLNDIKQQQEAADKAKDKKGKMAKLGDFGKVLDWTFKIAIIALAANFGPVVLSIALFYVIDSSVNKENPLMNQMFEAISDSCGQVGGIFVKTLVVSVLSFCNPLLFINLFGQESRVVQDSVAVMGGSELDQEITAMVFMLVAQVALMVAMTVVSGGAATPALMATVTGAVAKTTHMSLKAATIAVQIAYYTGQAAMLSLQATASGIKLNNSVLLAQMEVIKSKSEAQSEEIQALIAVMKKLIEKLLEILQGNSDWIANIGSLQGKKWTDANVITSEIFS